MGQKKKKIQDEAPRYNLKLHSSKNNKNSTYQQNLLSICPPPFCDEYSLNLLSRTEARQACPPKADHEPPKRS